MAFLKKKQSEINKDIKEEQNRSLVSEIKRKYKNAYDSKAELHTLWDKCYKAYTGELFKKNLPEYTSQEISNFVFSTVESIKPIMLADNPSFVVLPQKEDFLPKANVVQAVMDYEWQRTKMFSHLVRSCTSGLIFGTVPIALIWDKTSQRGLGDVKPIPISIFNFFVDPMATCIDDAEYCGYATYKNVGEVIKVYPDHAEELKKSTQLPTDEYLNYGKQINTSNSSNLVLYIELYMRDYTTYEEEFEEEVDGKTVKGVSTKLKYPNGRYICIAGDTLLADEENPYQDGKFPFVLWKCYDVPGRFWGMGEVEQVISPMQYHANLMNNVLDSARLTANAPWVVDKNSGIEKNSLTNRHGLVIRKNPGTDVHREQPPSMPAYIQNIIDKLEKHMEIIPGVYDVTRGERPSGITAGVAIQALNESAQGRIKLKVQALEQMLSELGGLWLSRVQQFWYTKRPVRTVGADYKPTYSMVDKDDVDGDFDVIVKAGSTMPVNKTAKLQQIISMAQTMAEDGLPVVDRKTILENADLPNIEQILQRFSMIQQQKAQEQQMQMQMQQQIQQQAQEQKLQAEAQKQALEHQNQKETMAMQHDQNMQSKGVDHAMNIDQMTKQNDMQNSNQNQNEEINAILEIIRYIMKLDAQQLSELVKSNPQIAKLVEMIQNMTPDELQQLQTQLESNNPQQ